MYYVFASGEIDLATRCWQKIEINQSHPKFYIYVACLFINFMYTTILGVKKKVQKLFLLIFYLLFLLQVRLIYK